MTQTLTVFPATWSHSVQNPGTRPLASGYLKESRLSTYPHLKALPECDDPQMKFDFRLHSQHRSTAAWRTWQTVAVEAPSSAAVVSGKKVRTVPPGICQMQSTHRESLSLRRQGDRRLPVHHRRRLIHHHRVPRKNIQHQQQGLWKGNLITHAQRHG